MNDKRCVNSISKDNLHNLMPHNVKKFENEANETCSKGIKLKCGFHNSEFSKVKLTMYLP